MVSLQLSSELSNETDTETTYHVPEINPKIENSTKIAVVSCGGIFRAPYITEVFNNWTVCRGLGRLVECEAFGVIDPAALSDTDPTIIHLLTSQKILFRGKPLALFKQETMKYYDFILATDKKSWFILRDLASKDEINKIELLSLYDPQRRSVDMPDVFFAMYRKDSGRKLQWMTGFIGQTVKAFMSKYIEDMKYRAGITTTTTTIKPRVGESYEVNVGFDDLEEVDDDINKEFDYTVPPF